MVLLYVSDSADERLRSPGGGDWLTKTESGPPTTPEHFLLAVWLHNRFAIQFGQFDLIVNAEGGGNCRENVIKADA